MFTASPTHTDNPFEKDVRLIGSIMHVGELICKV